MTDFVIPLPDGRRIKVDAADENEARQAAKNFLMREPGIEAGAQGGIDNFVRSLASGISYGGDQMLSAGANAAVRPVLDVVNPYVDWFLKNARRGFSRGSISEAAGADTSAAPTFGERYDENLERERAQSGTYAQMYPGWDATGKVIGGGAGAYATLPRALLAGGTGIIGGVGRSAVTGAGLGGVAGFVGGEGGFENRLANAGHGALIGGGLGAILHPVASGLGFGVNYAAETAPGRVVTEKMIQPAARLMSGVTGTADAVVPPTYGPGMSASAGHTPTGPGRPPPFDPNDPLNMAAMQRVTQALERGGADKNTVEAAQRVLTELGPGAAMADVNAMLSQLGATVFQKAGPARDYLLKALTERAEGTTGRVTGDIKTAMGDPRAAVALERQLKGERLGQGNVLYDAALSIDPKVPYVVSPEMQDLLEKTPSIRKAMADIVENFAQEGMTLTPAQVAHAVKRQLNLSADAAFAGGKAVDKNAIGATADKWRTALHEANPAIAAADQAWAAKSASLDALELGRQFMRQSTRAGGSEAVDAVSMTALSERIPRMTAEEARSFIAGAADTMIEIAKSGSDQARALAKSFLKNENIRDKLTLMLGENDANILFNRARSEPIFQGTKDVIAGGLSTARNLAGMADDTMMSGDIPTSTAAWLARGVREIARFSREGRAGNEAVRGRTAQLLMEQNPYTQAEMLDAIARRMAEAQRQTRGVQRGLVIGGTQVNQ